MDELLASELSADTLAALQAHLLERQAEEEVEEPSISEDFRLSQLCVCDFLFGEKPLNCSEPLGGSWYDEDTGRALAQEAIDHSSEQLKIAFVSTPAAYRDFLTIRDETEDEAKRSSMGDNVYVFEFDRRFGEKYGDHFVFYDYNSPTELPEKFHHFFDYVLAEPPHLTPTCLNKFADTIRWLAKDVEVLPGQKEKVRNPSTFINSWALREEMRADLGFTPTGFYPRFASKLSNKLFTYTNYTSDRFGPFVDPDDAEDTSSDTD